MTSPSKGIVGQEPQHLPGLSNPAPQIAADGRTSQGQGQRYLPLALPAADLADDLGLLPSWLLSGPPACDALS